MQVNLPNLKAEMARAGIKKKDIAAAIGCGMTAANSKVEGKSEFTLKEIWLIKRLLFPGVDIEYLFAYVACEQNQKGAAS